MPGLIGVSEFIAETREDYSSPTTSTFVSRMPQCRQTINSLEETLDLDREGLAKLKKAIKAIHNSGNAHVDNEMYLSGALERLGSSALSKEHEPADIGAAFLKFAVVTKELSALMKTLMQNINNIVMFPVESLLKGELRGVRGDLKRPFERAGKDYDSKYGKIEKERKSQAKEAGLIRSELSSAEIADEMEKERRLFQLHMCEYLIKFNEIKTKKGIELLQHLVEYYHAQTNYFKDGLKTIEYFGAYVSELSGQLQSIRQQQDEERRRLLDLRTMLRAATPHDKEGTGSLGGYSLHQMQGDKQHGVTKSGYLHKKSEGKVRRVWQKRRCRVAAEGFLDIFHADEAKTPARVNLLTCQIKTGEDKRGFDLVSYNRTYHFQAEDESEQRAWTSVLVNCKEGALLREFHQHGGADQDGGGSLLDLQRAVIRCVRALPGNQLCCDCGSTDDPTWLSTNFGIIVCIECSGIHRELGVHISRIQSLTLDRLSTSQLLLARHMANHSFNDVMEHTLDERDKLSPDSNMEERTRFIRSKYVSRAWVSRTCRDAGERALELEHAVNNGQLHALLQAYGEGADLAAVLPGSDCGETALHLAIDRDPPNGSRLHLVDFLVQNGGAPLLDRATASGLTPLHLCAALDKPEPMRLLLRAGADSGRRDAGGSTPLDIARQLGHRTCVELLESVERREKGLWEHVHVDWSLSHDDASTDFSDEDERPPERNGSVTPERRCSRSRPPSYAGGGGGGGGGGSPVPDPALATPTTLPRKPNMYNIGSLKKRTAPLPPAHAHPLPLPPRASPSPSADSTRSLHGTLKSRPQQPPPTPPPASPHPPPAPPSPPALHNGGSHLLGEPTPPPRKEYGSQHSSLELWSMEDTRRSDQSDASLPPAGAVAGAGGVRRCRALYDCSADNEDELSFREGEVIVVLNERTDDDNWMEGRVEGSPARRGMFPVSFVHMLPD